MNAMYAVFAIYGIASIIMACTPIEKWAATANPDKVLSIYFVCAGMLSFIACNLYYLVYQEWTYQVLLHSLAGMMVGLLFSCFVFVVALLAGSAIRFGIATIFISIKTSLKKRKV